MNAAKRSCFAWTIYSMQEVWKGSGTVPGPYKDTHSTRSEAFGILTMLQFLLQYLSRFPLVLTTAHPITLYCNNKGILQCLAPKKYKAPPKRSILDDYDVVAEIQQTIAAHKPLTIQLHHIKGHQDQKTSTQDLTLPAKLNIECDSRANSELPELQKYSIFLPHPMFPAAYPYLQVHNKLIVW